MSGAFRNCSVTGWLLLPGWSPIGGDDLECSRCQVRASFNVLSFVCARGSYAQPPVSGVLPTSPFRGIIALLNGRCTELYSVNVVTFSIQVPVMVPSANRNLCSAGVYFSGKNPPQ